MHVMFWLGIDRFNRRAVNRSWLNAPWALRSGGRHEGTGVLGLSQLQAQPVDAHVGAFELCHLVHGWWTVITVIIALDHHSH